MSLLLDALKKAALEKRRRDQETGAADGSLAAQSFRTDSSVASSSGNSSGVNISDVNSSNVKNSDINNSQVNNSDINKPGKLAPAEAERAQRHPNVNQAAAKSIPQDESSSAPSPEPSASTTSSNAFSDELQFDINETGIFDKPEWALEPYQPENISHQETENSTGVLAEAEFQPTLANAEIGYSSGDDADSASMDVKSASENISTERTHAGNNSNLAKKTGLEKNGVETSRAANDVAVGAAEISGQAPQESSEEASGEALQGTSQNAENSAQSPAPETVKKDPPPPTEKEAVASLLEASRKAALDAALTADGHTTPFTEESGKAAFAQLLGRSHKAAIKQKRRAWVALGALSLTALGVIGAYYFYLSWSAASVQFPVLESIAQVTPAASPEIAVDEASGEESSGEELVVEGSAVGELTDEGLAVEEPAGELSGEQTTAGALTTSGPDTKGSDTQAPDTKSATPNATGEAANTTAKQATAAAPKVSDVSKPATAPVTNPERVSLAPAPAVKEAAVIYRNEPGLDPTSEAIQAGYSAYQQGQWDEAARAYANALKLSPNHRDAVLGAAAVAVRQGRYQEALRWYQARLAAAPQDTHARAGILSMTGLEQVSPQLESEVNSLLRDYPQAAHLHFLKGSIQAARQQWSAAQSAFFEAARIETANPDYAFNLAVALDHLGQSREALNFYRQALRLGQGQQAGFDHQQVLTRIADLEPGRP